MSNETLLQHLKDWIAQAEASGIKVLQDFAAKPCAATRCSPLDVHGFSSDSGDRE